MAPGALPQSCQELPSYAEHFPDLWQLLREILQKALRSCPVVNIRVGAGSFGFTRTADPRHFFSLERSRRSQVGQHTHRLEGAEDQGQEGRLHSSPSIYSKVCLLILSSQ